MPGYLEILPAIPLCSNGIPPPFLYHGCNLNGSRWLHTTSQVFSGHAQYPQKEVTSLNNIVGQSLYVWSLYSKKFKLKSDMPLLSSFLGEPSFPPAFTTDTSFLNWTEKGLVNLESLLQAASFCSFIHLQQKFAMGRLDFYQYLQIRHFYSAALEGEVELIKTPFECLCGEASRDRGTISTFYRYLNDYNSTPKSVAMEGWETETAQEFPVEDCQT